MDRCSGIDSRNYSQIRVTESWISHGLTNLFRVYEITAFEVQRVETPGGLFRSGLLLPCIQDTTDRKAHNSR